MSEGGNPYQVAHARMEAMLADPKAYFQQAWDEARREARAAIAQRKSQQFSAESTDQDPELSQDMGEIVADFWDRP